MNFTIISLGNVELLSEIMNGVAAICGTADFARLITIGFVIGLLYIGFQCIFQGGQKINLHHSLLCFICYLCMFGPTCTVVIEDAFTGEARTVDNVPLGIGVAGTAISGIGYGATRLIETGYGDPETRITEHQFAEPLRILNQIRTGGKSDAVFEAIDAKLGNRSNGLPSDSKQALVNYLSECTYAKIQLGGTTAQKLYRSTWGSAEFQFNSQAHSTFLPIAGVTNETSSCLDAYGELNKIFTAYNSAEVLQVLNRVTYIKDYTGAIPSTSNEINTALTTLNATMENTQDFLGMMLVKGVYDQAATKYYTSYQDVASAIAVNQAVQQRNTQWASEGTMFLNGARALMAFFEAFIYAITPVMGFLIAVGAVGLSLVGKYFICLVWIQLWMPILSITNLYTIVGARSAVTDASLGNAPSFFVLDTLWGEAATWVSTGGMLAAATPMISLFLVTGSTYAFTSLAGRLGGQDHFNEKMASPDVAQPSAMLAMSSAISSDRKHGMVDSGAQAMIPKLNLSQLAASNEVAKLGTVNAVGQATAAKILEQGHTGASLAVRQAKMERTGESIMSQSLSDHSTMIQHGEETGWFGYGSREKAASALGEAATQIKAAGGIRFGPDGKAFDKDGKEVEKGVGFLGKALKVIDDVIEAIPKPFGSVEGSVTGGAKASDQASYSKGNKNQTSMKDSANYAESIRAAFSKGLSAQWENQSSKDWAADLRVAKGTDLENSYQENLSATKAFEQSQSLNKSAGIMQAAELNSIAKGVVNTPAEAELRKVVNENGLQHDAELWARESVVGNIRTGTSMAGLDYLQRNDPGKFFDVLSKSNFPSIGVRPDKVSTDDIEKPVDPHDVINKTKEEIGGLNKFIGGNKPSAPDMDQAQANLDNRNVNNQKDVDIQAGANAGIVIAMPKSRALDNLAVLPKEGIGLEFAQNLLSGVPFWSAIKSHTFESESPAEKADASKLEQLSSGQAHYMNAYHELERIGVNNPNAKEFVAASAEQKQALESSRQEMRQEIGKAIYGTKKDGSMTELSPEQNKQLDTYTSQMEAQVVYLYNNPNRGNQGTIEDFNKLYRIPNH